MIESHGSYSHTGECDCAPSWVRLLTLLGLSGWPGYSGAAKSLSNLNLVLRSCVQVSALPAKARALDTSPLGFVERRY